MNKVYTSVTFLSVTFITAVSLALPATIFAAKQTVVTADVSTVFPSADEMNEDAYRDALLDLLSGLKAQLEAIKAGDLVLEPLRLIQPSHDNLTVEEGQSIRIRWEGGNPLLPVAVRVLGNSANYYCVKSGAEICPMDVSLPVAELMLENDGEVNLAQPLGRTGEFIVELSQFGDVVYIPEPVEIVER